MRNLKIEDTFNNWRVKINEMLNGSIVGSFGYDDENSTNLNFIVKEGKLRLGSQVVNITESVAQLQPTQTNIVVLYTDPNINEVRVYTEGAVPPSYVIPLFRVVTDVNTVTNIEDLRTWVDLSGSANDADSGILTFNQNISFDREIPAGRNAVSVDPIVEDGVTVTVTDGSTWVVL